MVHRVHLHVVADAWVTWGPYGFNQEDMDAYTLCMYVYRDINAYHVVSAGAPTPSSEVIIAVGHRSITVQ